MSDLTIESFSSVSVSGETKQAVLDLLEGEITILTSEEKIFIELDELNENESDFYAIMADAGIQEDDLALLQAILLY